MTMVYLYIDFKLMGYLSWLAKQSPITKKNLCFNSYNCEKTSDNGENAIILIFSISNYLLIYTYIYIQIF